MTHSISRKKINTCDTESDQLIFWIWSSSTHKTSAKCTSQNYGFYELLWYNKYYIYMLICQLIKIVWLIISQNLSELQPFLGNWISGSRNAEKGVSECSILKICWDSIPPDPPPPLRKLAPSVLARCLVPPKNFALGALRNMSTTLKNLSRTLIPINLFT